MKSNANKKRWTKPRHRLVRNLLSVTLGVYTRLKYNVKVEKFKEQEKRPYLILFNHQTAFDQFFVGMAFRGPIYYMASEDIFSNGKLSSLIRYLVAPIPIKKQTVDVKAITTSIRVAREGGTIAIAPEGNRTYSGKTEYMNPSIAMLARKLGMPIALFRIEGGYGVHPRWSDVVRKGKMHCRVAKVISPEQYTEMSDDELFEVIEKTLYVDEANVNGEFIHKKSVEYLERAIYVCDSCGLSEFESRGDVIECKRCQKKIRYLKTKELSGVGFDFPFRFVSDWYTYQCDYINKTDLTAIDSAPSYVEDVSLSEVVPYKKKILIDKDAKIKLYGTRVTLNAGGEEREYPFDSLAAVTVLGKNKLNIYADGKIYQLKGGKRFNALKYVNFYHRYKNIKKGDSNVAFLGL